MCNTFMFPLWFVFLSLYVHPPFNWCNIIRTLFLNIIWESIPNNIIYNIPELCSEFHVVDVGFIMALLRREYSCQHQLINKELVLEMIFVPWDLYASMTNSLTFYIGSHHWPSIERFHWVFDIKTSIHTR